MRYELRYWLKVLDECSHYKNKKLLFWLSVVIDIVVIVVSFLLVINMWQIKEYYYQRIDKLGCLDMVNYPYPFPNFTAIVFNNSEKTPNLALGTLPIYAQFNVSEKYNNTIVAITPNR